MIKIVNIYNGVSISERYSNQNLKSYNKLCVGKYKPENEVQDEYEILIKLNFSFMLDGLYSIDRVVLRLYNPYKPEQNTQKLYFCKNDGNFDVNTVTWDTKPLDKCSAEDESVEVIINQDAIDEKYLDIDITKLVEKGIAAVEENCGITIKGDENIENTIVYFENCDSDFKPQILIEYTPISEVYGYVVNSNETSISTEEIIDPGTIKIGSHVEVVNSKTNASGTSERVIQFNLPGVYELDFQFTNIDYNGEFSLVKGDINKDISQFTEIYKTQWGYLDASEPIKIKEISRKLLFSADKIKTQVAIKALSEFTSGFETSIIAKRISVMETIIIDVKSDSDNPFIGGDIENVNYILNIDKDIDSLILGIDEETSIRGNIKIKGDLLNDKKVILKNLNVHGTVEVDIENGDLDLESTHIDLFRIFSAGVESIGFKDDSSADEIQIMNTKPIKIEIAKDADNVNINTINLIPESDDIDEAKVILGGNFGNTKIVAEKPMTLAASDSEDNKLDTIMPIEVALNEASDKEIKFTGDFTSTAVEVTTAAKIIGDSESPPEGLTLKIAHENSDEDTVVLEGDLTEATLNIETESIITVLEETTINDIVVKELEGDKKVTLDLRGGAVVNEIELAGTIVLDGSIDEVIGAIQNTTVTNETAKIELGSELEYLQDLVTAITNVEKYFVGEINNNITLEEIINIANENVSGINVSIDALQPEEGEVFYLSGNTIQFISPTVDKSKLDKHKAELTLTLSKGSESERESESIEKVFILKGKYKNISIDYETNTAVIELDEKNNEIEYSIANPIINTIKLNTDIENYQQVLSINVSDRNLTLNLNNHQLDVNYIVYSDVICEIKNGTLKPNDDISKWYDEGNEIADVVNKYFIKINKSNKYAELIVDNITIENPIIDFLNIEEESTNTVLIGTSADDESYPVDKLVVKNSNLELTKQTDSNKDNGDAHVICTFANVNIIESNNFLESYRCICVNGAFKDIDITAKISDNDFSEITAEDNYALTIIPYSDKGNAVIFLNSVVIAADMSNNELIEKLTNMAAALTTDIPEVIKKNTFGKGTWIYLWQNENGDIIRRLQFNGDSWDVLVREIKVIGEDGITEITTYMGTLQMIAHVLPQDSTDKSITWSVEPKGIGTISNNGLLTALAEGIANVIAENEFSGVSGINKIGMKFSSLPDPPELIPDTTDNDMMHPIEISFEPMKIWTDNIEQIKVENTQDRVLDESEYEINGDSGKIIIKNVEYAHNGMPVYTGILDVADNTIIVKAGNFKDAEVNQVLKPNQIIDVVHGSGDGIFRICKIGDYVISAKVISPGENSEIEIKNSINITMVKVIPSYGEENVQLDVLLQVIFNKELRLINTEEVSIKDSNDIEIGNIEVYLSEDNKVIEIRHDDFEPRKEYTVNIPRGAVEYVNGILDKGIIWSFET